MLNQSGLWQPQNWPRKTKRSNDLDSCIIGMDNMLPVPKHGIVDSDSRVDNQAETLCQSQCQCKASILRSGTNCASVITHNIDPGENTPEGCCPQFTIIHHSFVSFSLTNNCTRVMHFSFIDCFVGCRRLQAFCFGFCLSRIQISSGSVKPNGQNSFEQDHYYFGESKISLKRFSTPYTAPSNHHHHHLYVPHHY